MSEHLFLGDTTYPHTPALNLVETLRNFGDQAIVFDERVLMQKAADRIEQLERELAESKKRTSCGYELTFQLLKITPLYLKKGDFIDRPSMVDCIVEWRKQIDKIDAAIREGKA